MKPTVLIVCTGNSCRSHMAEGVLRAAAGDMLNVQSAGSNPKGFVHPLAIQVMKEIGIDITGHKSKHMNDFLNEPLETVITVCKNAEEACPMFSGRVNRYFWGFDDPARATGTDEEKLAAFRRARDEIRQAFETYAAGRRDQARSHVRLMNRNLKVLQVFNPATSCSTGACGPEAEAKVAQFAADLEWLKSVSVIVQRYDYAPESAAFMENEFVRRALDLKGEKGLPVVVANDEVAIIGRYPERKELAALLKVDLAAATDPVMAGSR